MDQLSIAVAELRHNMTVGIMLLGWRRCMGNSCSTLKFTI